MKRLKLESLLLKQVINLSRHWEYFINYHLDQDLTFQQLLLLATLESEFEQPPLLGEAAEKLYVSYQNVKKLALQLEKKGFVRLLPDQKDRRGLRIELTEQNHNYWEARDQADNSRLSEFFTPIDDQQVQDMVSQMALLVQRAEEIRDLIRSGSGKKQTIKE